MERAQAGDKEAYRALLENLAPPLDAFLRRHLRDADERQDVAQDTFLAMHRARHTYEPVRPFEPWFFAIARHTLIDHTRRRTRRIGREVAIEVAPEPAAGSLADAERQLAAALLRLPPTQRQALELLTLSGLTVADAAERAGTTTGALKVRAHRAYRTLRALLLGEGA